MEDHKFYVLVPRLEGDAVTEFLGTDDASYGDVPRCEKCGQFVGTRPWLPPLRVEIETWGNEFGDMAYAFGSSLLVSPRFREVYDENGLRGLGGFECVEVKKVKCHKKSRGEMPRYLRAEVFRNETAIDPVASGVEWEDEKICCRCLIGTKLKRRRRIVVDEKTWTGDDIFILRGLPGELVASKRFKEVCERNHITNTVFVPAAHRR